MNLRSVVAGIETNLDDLQSYVEACVRAAQTIQSDAAAVERQMSGPNGHADLVSALVARASEVQACARDQVGALRELRHNVAMLCAALKLTHADPPRR